MTHSRKKLGIVSILTVSIMVLSLLASNIGLHVSGNTPKITPYEGELNTNLLDFLDKSVAYQLPSTVDNNDTISVIIQGKEDCLYDVYEASHSQLSFGDFSASYEGGLVKDKIDSEKQKLLSILDNTSVEYELGLDYHAILSGFEVTIVASDFLELATALEDHANVIVGDVYEVSETELVENDVNVYETGIFDSSKFSYDGTGMVVAILDTGLDYFHTAFSMDNFKTDASQLGMTFADVEKVIGDTKAAILQNGLTASDVFVSNKVPFAFDYADYDSDVFPINSNHGTHVAGIVAGKDDTITGVAPGAQLAIMKTFSDVESTARTSWILAALNDCVTLGVDVINMSLGTACGFSRESDREALDGVYDRIRRAGISMVCAGSNSFSSAYGSEKNGNLGLTSNPDTGTVSSPGTYPGTLTVASVNGAKTPYILFNGRIIYFNESSDRVNEEKNFFDDLLPDGVDSKEFEYVTIAGVGRPADYAGMDVKGKIVLIRRGSNTFEEKANAAQEMGAAGIIVYNNVSGDIRMNVGDATLAVCSIRQDDGEVLAAAGSGTLTINRQQVSGPFMSDFSSWGPTPDLGIKPEITAHGGSILSAVPGQSYDRISGTSMACPNMSGVTALLRQYVTVRFPELKDEPVAVTALVNQLLMSTADIVRNVNGLPYAVRKQGAGLANLDKAAATLAYIITYNKDGSEMSASKLELGDDPSKTGVYTLHFSLKNFGDTSLTYALGAHVMTEGVSDTLTAQGETTVTEQGYLLSGAKVEITEVKNGALNGKDVTVNAGATADITVKITLSQEDKDYLDTSFENGMFVEGFVTLTAKDAGSVNLSVPYLAFYGDWTQAPLFDLDYYQTNRDELDDAIDPEDKIMADAYATRPIGAIQDDYVSYMGSYYFIQNPSDKIISASRDYIAISNQEGTVHSLRFVWAGLLRGAERVVVTITDTATGEVIYSEVKTDIRKSYGDGGDIRPAQIELEFDAAEYDLKNNTQYMVHLKGYMDYGDGGETTNLNNEFSFPLYSDFEAPTITDCDFYTEYDRANKKTRLFAKMAIYDNHYAMSAQVGYVELKDNVYTLQNFTHYLTPIYSSYNSTTYVTYELTDYINMIRDNAAERNTFTVSVYDYALNMATFEIALPDDYTDFHFAEEEIVLSPNEVYTLTPLCYPGTEWTELLQYFTSNPRVATAVNNKVVAIASGVSEVIAYNPETKERRTIRLRVLGEGDEGYVRYSKPVAETFKLTGFHTNKAYYQLDSTQRDIGSTGDDRLFYGNSYRLSMYPSESVTLQYEFAPYFPDDTEIVFESGNNSIVTVNAAGTIVAQKEGFSSVSVKVKMDGKNTLFSANISIEVKDPYITTGPSLTHYFGLGGSVIIPDDLHLTDIGQFAFSNFDYIPKEEGEEVSDEAPGYTKIWFLGDNTIESVVIPEGVKTIGPYAFANLTALRRVVLPSTIESIDYGAFAGCTSLTAIEGLENVKFINQGAFQNCALSGNLTFEKTVAVADYAFQNNKALKSVSFSSEIQSIGMFAFSGCSKMETLEVASPRVKLGQYAFSGCSSLKEAAINSAVLPEGLFSGCTSMTKVTIGKDVAVIGENAFAKTNISKFTVDSQNAVYYPVTDQPYLVNKNGDTILQIAPSASGNLVITDSRIVAIGPGAASGNRQLLSVVAPSVTSIGDSAFSGCTLLTTVSFGNLTHIGNRAFYNSRLTVLPDLSHLTEIGDYAFMMTKLTQVVIPDGTVIGDSAFRECSNLVTVVIGDGVVVGSNAFRYDKELNFKEVNETVGNKRIYYYVFTSPIRNLTIGDGVTLESGAFMGNAELTSVTLGEKAVIGDRAFFNCATLTDIDLSLAVSIGDFAFSGDILNEFSTAEYSYDRLSVDANGNPILHYYAADLKEVDLGGIVSLGKGAFAYCTHLETVELPATLTEIPAEAFQMATALSSINLGEVTLIGDSAFESTSLGEIDLSGVAKIGKYAFYACHALEEITLSHHGVALGEGAFSSCGNLETVNNDRVIADVGDYAFAYTAITRMDLTSATHIGKHAFIREEATPFHVELGEGLEEIGENPFAMCILEAFSRQVKETFNGKDYEQTVYTFDLSENVRIIDGSIYRVVPKGLELITYAGNHVTYRVADGTVRLSAYAMAGSYVEQVVFPHTLDSIGHKALYGCYDLRLVTFTGYDAPRLEEQFDYNYYFSGDNIPATDVFYYTVPGVGTEEIKEGLGIVPYFMWDVANQPTSVFYGANFVDYIGYAEGNVTMIRPSNGKNYDSFIFSQYFDVVLDGAVAADDVTLFAMDCIDLLPEKITLADKALVLAAREAYNKISTLEQQALMTVHYGKLTNAEKRIADLESLQTPEDVPGDAPAPETPKNNTLVIGIILAVDGAVALAIGGYFLVRYLLNKKKKETDISPEAQPPETTDSKGDNQEE